MNIRIIGPALADPAQRIEPERLSDLIGCAVEADGRAVTALRERHPGLAVYADTYAVTIADVLEALALKPTAHIEALPAWGQLIENCLVYFPAGSVEIITTPEGV